MGGGGGGSLISVKVIKICITEYVQIAGVSCSVEIITMQSLKFISHFVSKR